MTCQWMSRSRTLAASSTQRLVSQAQGHSGSNQKSTRADVGALCTASVIVRCSSQKSWDGAGRCRHVRGKSRPPTVVPSTIGGSAGGGGHPSSTHGKLPVVAVPNLTRDDAAARAALLTVQSYDLSLDVTDGAGHPG